MWEECHDVFVGVTKCVYFDDLDGNRLEVYCNVPADEYAKSVSNPYSRYGGIEAVLEGKISQKPGAVAPLMSLERSVEVNWLLTSDGWLLLYPVIRNSRISEILAEATIGACRECAKLIRKNASSSN